MRFRFDDASICKEGTEVTQCPAHAVCRVGMILSCDFPFDVDDGEGCVLNAAFKDEMDVVVGTLRFAAFVWASRDMPFPASETCGSSVWVCSCCA